MKMTTVSIVDRTGKLDHRCLESHHYIEMFEPVINVMGATVPRFMSGFLARGNLEMSCYSSTVGVICGPTGMSKAIETLKGALV